MCFGIIGSQVDSSKYRSDAFEIQSLGWSGPHVATLLQRYEHKHDNRRSHHLRANGFVWNTLYVNDHGGIQEIDNTRCYVSYVECWLSLHRKNSTLQLNQSQKSETLFTLLTYTLQSVNLPGRPATLLGSVLLQTLWGTLSFWSSLDINDSKTDGLMLSSVDRSMDGGVANSMENKLQWWETLPSENSSASQRGRKGGDKNVDACLRSHRSNSDESEAGVVL